MVGMNRAALIAQIGALTTPKVTEGRSLDIAGAINSFNQGYDRGRQISAQKEANQNKQDLIDALTGAHPDDAALIKSDPEAYAKMLQDNANAERDQQYKMDVLGKKFENALALEDKRNANAIGLKRLAQSIRAGEENNAMAQRLAAFDLPEGVALTGNDEYDKVILKDAAEKAVKAQENAENDERSRKQAQDSINQLASVADRNNIGVFTDWFRSKGLTGSQVEKDLGEISSAVAGLAPRAISNLKNAGVSGINSLQEFMTYIGLPQNPTSKQIAGAIPMMAQIAGVENPYAQKEVNNQAPAENIKVGQTIGRFKIIGVE